MVVARKIFVGGRVVDKIQGQKKYNLHNITRFIVKYFCIKKIVEEYREEKKLYKLFIVLKRIHESSQRHFDVVVKKKRVTRMYVRVKEKCMMGKVQEGRVSVCSIARF